MGKFLLGVMKMSKLIDSKDSLLPSFSHSSPFKSNARVAEVMNCDGRLLFLSIKADSLGITRLPDTEFIRKSTESDISAGFHRKLIDEYPFTPIESLRESCRVVCDDLSGTVVMDSSEESIIIVRVHPERGIEVNSFATPDLNISNACVCDGEVFMVDSGGSIWKTSNNMVSLDVTKPFSKFENSNGAPTFISEASKTHMLLSSGTRLFSIDKISGQLNEVEIIGAPEEFTAGSSFEAITQAGDHIVIMSLSSDMMDVCILFGHLDGGTQFMCDYHSINEIFISQDNNSVRKGFLHYVPQLSLVLAGHSLCDSVALFRIQPITNQIDCMILPEGKQLGCSLIDGDSSTCNLRFITSIVLESPVPVPRSSEIVECRFCVVTGQMDGWITLHYAELPLDWKVMKKQSALSVAGVDAMTKPTIFSAPVDVKKDEKPLLFGSASVSSGGSLFGSFGAGSAPAASTPSGGLFGAPSLGAAKVEDSTKPPVAAAPPMFDSSIKPPASLGSFEVKKDEKPSLFGSASVSSGGSLFGSFGAAPAPAASKSSGGLFGAPSLGAAEVENSIKPPVAAAPPMFDSSIKPPASLGSIEMKKDEKPLLFGASSGSSGGSLFGSFGTSSGTSAVVPSGGLFGAPTLGTTKVEDSLKPPVAAAPPMFDSSIKPPASLESFEVKKDEKPSLFGSASGSSGGSLFGSFGAAPAPSASTPSGGLFGAPSLGAAEVENSIKPPVAAAPPMFDSSIKPPASLGSVEMKKDETPSLFGSASGSSGGSLFGSFGAGSTPSASTTSGGLFGAPSLGTTKIEDSVKPAVAAAPPLFDSKIKPPASAAAVVSETEHAKPTTDRASKYPGVAIDSSLEALFEDELKAWESIRCELPIEKFVHMETPNSRGDDDMKQMKDRLLSIRKCIDSMDDELRTLYGSDSVSVGEESRRIQAKCEELHQRVEIITRDMRKVVRTYKPKGLGRISKIGTPPQERVTGTPREYGIYRTPAKSSPSITASPGLGSVTMPLAHPPLAPSLRLDAPGGFGFLTPVKSSPRVDFQALTNEFKRDSYTSRLSGSGPLLRSPAGSAKHNLTLADMLGSRAVGTFVAPSLDSSIQAPTGNSGHGAAWKLLRQVEQQRKQIEAITRQIVEMGK